MTSNNLVWKIRLLGGFHVERLAESQLQGLNSRQQSIHPKPSLYKPTRIDRFRTRKTASLLAYLALNLDAAHSRDKLIELLWPEASPKAGRNSLRVSLNALRNQLEADESCKGQIILSQGQTLQLNPDHIQTDVQCFEDALATAQQTPDLTPSIQQLQTAIAHYGGEFLPGDPSAWVEQEAMRLADLHLSAVYQLGELLFEAGEFNQALSYAHQSIQLDPFCDTCHFLLMQLQLALNRPARAIQQYRELSKSWQAEFDAPPPNYIRTWIDELMAKEK